MVDALKIAGSQLYYATPATAGWSDESSPSLAYVLTIVQSAAIMEIVHAVLGLVRSPVFVTMMQVGSRIVALHMVNTSPKAQSKSIYIFVKQSFFYKMLPEVILTLYFYIDHMICTIYFIHCSTMGSGSYDHLMGPC